MIFTTIQDFSLFFKSLKFTTFFLSFFNLSQSTFGDLVMPIYDFAFLYRPARLCATFEVASAGFGPDYITTLCHASAGATDFSAVNLECKFIAPGRVPNVPYFIVFSIIILR